MVPKKSDKKDKLITRDWLAVERTKLANERTFLAYFRTAIAFLASGLTIMKIDFFSDIHDLGLFLTLLAPVIFIIGVARLLRVKKVIKRYYDESAK